MRRERWGRARRWRRRPALASRTGPASAGGPGELRSSASSGRSSTTFGERPTAPSVPPSWSPLPRPPLLPERSWAALLQVVQPPWDEERAT